MVQFIRELGKYKEVLPKKTIKALKGQALSGDLDGAEKGLKKVLSYEYKQTQLRRLCGSYSIPSTIKHREKQ